MLLSNIIQTNAVEMADVLRQDGKFWVVIVVVFSVLIGLLIYLTTIDFKISKIEKQLKK